MNILFNIIGLAILFIGEWLDYSSTMRLHKAGWLNTRINDRSQQINSREVSGFFMEGNTFLVKRFFIAKIALTAFGAAVTVSILIFAEDQYYHIAPFIFNLIVGIYHAHLGLRNNKNFAYIKEVLGRN